MSNDETLFPFLSKTKAEAAFNNFVLPSIIAAMEMGHVKRPCLHVVALEPGVPYDPEAEKLPILFERSINPTEWESPYNQYAEAKAWITWRTGEPSRSVVLTKPHLLQPGDPRFWGSAILDGIIVGVSGVESCFDEMFAVMTAAALRAEASYYAAKADKMGDGAPDFIPLPSLRLRPGRPSRRLRLGEIRAGGRATSSKTKA